MELYSIRKGTFNLPSLTDGRVLAGTAGSYIGTKTNGQVPNISGGLTAVAMNPFDSWGFCAVGASSGTVPGPNSGSIQRRYIDFFADRSSNLYVTNATQVRAASVFIAFCIKY